VFVFTKCNNNLSSSSSLTLNVNVRLAHPGHQHNIRSIHQQQHLTSKMITETQSENGFRRKTITIYEDDSDEANNSGRVTKKKMGDLRRCMSAPTTGLDILNISSIMKWTTLDESIGHSYGSDRSGERRSLQFGKVKIREYARTVGDNPSCSSGPPVR
jgi:hypothetical protein